MVLGINKYLESKIKERKKQAERREISSKAWMVAKYLGEREYYRSSDGGFERTIHAFSNDDFSIINRYSESHGHDGSMGGGSTDIEYKGKKVFEEAGSGIISYIPGGWEKKLSQLYGKAVKVMNQQKQEEQEKNKKLAKEEEDKEKSKWGL